jgi:hypothetical protein
MEKRVREEACGIYAYKTEQQLAGIYRVHISHIHRTLHVRAVEAGEKACAVVKTESHTVEMNMPRIIEMGHSCYEVLRYIKKNRLAWMDEFGIKYSVGHNSDKARTRKGSPAFSEQTYRQKNAHVAIAISPDGVLKVSASDESFKGACAYAFLCESQPRIESMPYIGGQAVYLMQDRLKGVQFMGMDKLGRAGKAKEPTTGHYEPRIFECFKSVGIRAFQLPPKGCLFNVVEVVNNMAQRFCERWTPEDHGRDEEFPNHGKDAQGRQYTGPQNFVEVLAALSDWIKSLREVEEEEEEEQEEEDEELKAAPRGGGKVGKGGGCSTRSTRSTRTDRADKGVSGDTAAGEGEGDGGSGSSEEEEEQENQGLSHRFFSGCALFQ